MTHPEGRQTGEPIGHYGPFVMRSRDEILQALEDFEGGSLGTVPADRLAPWVLFVRDTASS
ncbi:MAG TPA: pirin-like C-terminal cupin domain-containing protein [Acidimicrobiales bacterium]